jgi:hypothetical protein
MAARLLATSRRALLALLLGLLLLGGAPSASSAAPAAVALEEGKPALGRLEGGGWSVKLHLTNLTDRAVRLAAGSVRPLTGGACTVQFETGPTATLKPAQRQLVTVTYSQGCSIGSQGALLRLTTIATPAQILAVAAAPSTEPAKPDWEVLWAFGAALLASAAVLFAMLLTNERMTFGIGLTHLPTAWSFKDSWATNVTAGVGIVAAVVGSANVVKAFLGAEAEAAVAVAIVGAAVAAGFLALGALLVQTIKHVDSEAPTAVGFVVGASCTLAGAFGELVTLYVTGTALDLGGWQHRIVWIVIAIGLVLMAYAVVSVRATLELGTQVPKKELSESTVTAVYVASETSADVRADEVFELIERRLWPSVAAPTNARLRVRAGTRKFESSPAKRVGAALL